MRVRADRQHTGADNALLGENDVLDADAPLLIVVQDVVFACKVTHDLRQLRGLNVLCRLEMIGNQRDLRTVKDGSTRLFKLLDGRRPRHIVCKHHVETARHELPRLDVIQSRMACENLLAHIHAHSLPS